MKRIILLFVLLLIGIIAVQAQGQDTGIFKLHDVIGRGIIDDIYWTSDGETIAVTTVSGIWLYQADDLNQLPHHLPFEGPVIVAFDPTSPTMAVSEENGIGLYDLTTGERFRVLYGRARYSILAFSMGGGQLAAVVDPKYSPLRDVRAYESFIHVWAIYPRDVEPPYEGPPLEIYITPNQWPPQAVAFSPDGQKLAVVSIEGGPDYVVWRFFMLDLSTGEVLGSLDYSGKPIDNYQLTDDRLVLSSYGGFRYFAAFDPEPERFGIEILSMDDQEAVVYALSWDARIALIRGEDTLEIQETHSGEALALLPVAVSERVAFSLDNTRIALVNKADRLEIYDISQLAEAPIPCDEPSPACITYTDAYIPQPITDQEGVFLEDNTAISPSGEWAIVAEHEQESRYYLENRLHETRVELELQVDGPNMGYIQFNADESILAISFTTYYMDGTDDEVVRIWDLREGLSPSQPIAILPHNFATGQLIFSPDQTLLITTNRDGGVFAWDTTTWQKVATLPHPREVEQLVFSEDGKRLTTLAEDGLTRIWRIETP